MVASQEVALWAVLKRPRDRTKVEWRSVSSSLRSWFPKARVCLACSTINFRRTLKLMYVFSSLVDHSSASRRWLMLPVYAASGLQVSDCKWPGRNFLQWPSSWCLGTLDFSNATPSIRRFSVYRGVRILGEWLGTVHIPDMWAWSGPLPANPEDDARKCYQRRSPMDHRNMPFRTQRMAEPSSSGDTVDQKRRWRESGLISGYCIIIPNACACRHELRKHSNFLSRAIENE